MEEGDWSKRGRETTEEMGGRRRRRRERKMKVREWRRKGWMEVTGSAETRDRENQDSSSHVKYTYISLTDV